MKRVDGKLSNEGFISKAPEKVINEEKAKRSNMRKCLPRYVKDWLLSRKR